MIRSGRSVSSFISPSSPSSASVTVKPYMPSAFLTSVWTEGSSSMTRMLLPSPIF
jgi:hypothetical protein